MFYFKTNIKKCNCIEQIKYQMCIEHTFCSIRISQFIEILYIEYLFISP